MNRRLFLHSSAATVWLPYLHSAMPRETWGEPPAGPRRMVYWFVPNGLHRDAVTPGGPGADVVLAPLQRLRRRITSVSGLHNLSVGVHATHEAATSSALSDSPIRPGGVLAAGMSVDQVAARHLDPPTPAPSLQLGLDEPGMHSGGVGHRYASTISWGDRSRPLPKLTEPRRLFERMFGRARESVLDALPDRLRGLDRGLASEDRVTLERYLTRLREVERSLDALDRPADPSHRFASSVRAMADLVVLALASDHSRIVTFMVGPSAARTVYRHLGHTVDHHTLSHSRIEEGARLLAEVQRWHMEQLARTLRQLEAIPEGEGDLLANTAFTVLSEFGDPITHDARGMTWLLAGGEAGGFRPGRTIAADRPHSDHHRAILQFMGVPPGRFGQHGSAPLDFA